MKKKESTDEAPFGLEVIESAKGRLAEYKHRAIVSIGRTVSTVNARALERAGVRTDAGHQVTLAINPADKSTYFGVLPARGGRRGFTIRRSTHGENYSFNSAKIAKRVEPGVYEICGPGKEYAGATWYPLILIDAKKS